MQSTPSLDEGTRVPSAGEAAAAQGVEEPTRRCYVRGPWANVLVGADLSHGGQLAVARALHLPCCLHAKVSVVHAQRADTDDALAREESARLAALLEEARLRAFVSEGRCLPPPELVPAMVHGRADTEIVRAAREQGSELIVIGRHGKSPPCNEFLGATAEGVIRRAGTPVLVVSQPVSGPYERPIVAVDFSQTSRLAIEAALQMTDGAAIDVVNAHGAPADDLPLGFVWKDYAQETRAQLEEFLRPYAEAGVSWNLLVERGDPKDVIVDAAAWQGSDLIVLGSWKRTAMDDLVAENVADAVVRAAWCDVLVVRPKEDADAVPSKSTGEARVDD